jgi:CRISPR-associated endonuclease/helicase Cas3
MKPVSDLAHSGQPLPKHLIGVAKQSQEFASFFGGAMDGWIAGLLHDLGKAEDEIQKRIATDDKEGKKEPHAHHGAALLLDDREKTGFVQKPFWATAFAINGHHAGLHDRSTLQNVKASHVSKANAAWKRLNSDTAWADLRNDFDIAKFSLPPSHLPDWLNALPFDATFASEGWRAVDFYTRFLFSALVDADRLDTEINDLGLEKSVEQRRWREFDAEALLALVEEQLRRECDEAERNKVSADVRKLRVEVGNFCRRANLHKERGIFTLTVPTGGGKTLASLLFALHHAKHHNKAIERGSTIWRHPFRRVIIVIPYLSIIQQTAAKLQRLFGDVAGDGKALSAVRTVLEHHSQASDPPLPEKKDTDAFGLLETRRRFAAENWDAPLIVTTSVQFFDSLFKRRTADARKLHNIAQSVIIFDEVQTLPPHLLRPILDALGELTSPERPYGCSVVLCTATQPALAYDSVEFPCGLHNGPKNKPEPVRPIIPEADARRHFSELNRTRIVGLSNDEPRAKLKPPDLAKEMLAAPGTCALAIVNTRKAARQCFEALRKACAGQDDLARAMFHLSTWMTPAHRLEVLSEVRERLLAEMPCLLISTQCIEAGVDVDFPAVWRAYGPYDSIVQAAGRCNRNGKLGHQGGTVHVFDLDSEAKLSGVYASAIEQTSLLSRLGLAKPEVPESFTTYFRLLYQSNVPDDCEIQRERGQLHFEEVSKLFNLIESFTTPVLVLDMQVDGQPVPTPARAIYEAACRRVTPDGKGHGWFTRNDWREIQRFIVNVDYRNDAAKVALAKHSIPVFDVDNLELRIWNAGNAGYIGGLNGTGFNFEKIDTELFKLLSGGL